MHPLLLPWRTTSFFLVFGFLFFSAATLPACKSTDLVGMQNATNLSTQLTTLMNKANEPFAKHSDEIKSAMSALMAAEQHATEQPRNKIIAKQWTTLRTGLVEPFITRWKEGKLDKDFIKEAVLQVQNSLAAIRKAGKK